MPRVRTPSVLIVLLLALVPWSSALPAATAPPIDYVLLIDNSGSMAGDRGLMALEAAKLFIDLMGVGDYVSVYTFGAAERALLEQTPTRVGDQAERELTKSQVGSSFDEDRTDITRGVSLVWDARSTLFPRRSGSPSSPTGAQSMVVLLTDGDLIPAWSPPFTQSQYEALRAESERRLVELAGLLGVEQIPIYTVGLGDPSEFNGELLKLVAAESGGQFHHAEGSVNLPDTYYEILAAIGALNEIVPHDTTTFEVDGSVQFFRVVVTRGADASEPLRLYDPDGVRLQSTDCDEYTPELRDDVVWSAESTYDVVTVEDPKVGEWRLSTAGRVSVQSLLLLKAKELRPAYQAGEGVAVQASVHDLERDANAANDLGEFSIVLQFASEADWKGNNLSDISRLELKDDGGATDEMAGDGVYSGLLILSEPGLYRLRYVAMGSYHGAEFYRYGKTVPIEVLPAWFQFESPCGSATTITRHASPQLSFVVRMTDDSPVFDLLEVAATLVTPGLDEMQIDLPAVGHRAFGQDVDNLVAYGDYTVRYRVRGFSAEDGSRVDVSSQDYQFVLVRDWIDRLVIGAVVVGAVVLLAAAIAILIGLLRGESLPGLLAAAKARLFVRLSGQLVPDTDAELAGAMTIDLAGLGARTVKLGKGTPYMPHAESTLVELHAVRGQRDPLVSVLEGSASVGGIELRAERRLHNGEELRIEGRAYHYKAR